MKKCYSCIFYYCTLELDPGIPGFVDHFEGESPGVYYLVMELAPGVSLDRRKSALAEGDEVLFFPPVAGG